MLNSKETLTDLVARIWDAVESGRTPEAQGGVADYLYRELKALRDLGDGDLRRGFQRRVDNERRKNKRRSVDEPVHTLLDAMSQAENPVHRALARIAGEWPEHEFEARAKSALAEEIAKSANVPPEIVDAVPQRRIELDELCVKWVSRGYMPKGYNYSEFLNENSIEWISVDGFKRALIDAHRRGVIDQDPKTKRYRPKTPS